MDKTRITNANKNNYMPAGLRGRAIKEINMSDLIDRQQAIEAICMETCGVSLKTERCMVHCTEVQTVEKLPPAQPERIKSKWALHTYMPHNKFCLACRNDSPYNKRWDFCPNCGADMREVTE